MIQALGYRLDVDTPYDMPMPPAEGEGPAPLYYNTDPARRRHYGREFLKMVVICKHMLL